MTEILDSALALAITGTPVFPCTADKRPACDHGHLDATDDPDALTRLFATPRAALIGVPTGAASGVDVLDIDPRNGGDRWLRENEHLIPPTRRHHTKSGGVHILFQHAPGLRCSADDRLAPGVDVRSDGGYAIWWPAHGLFEGGPAPAPWPTEILTALLQRQHARAPGAPPADPAELAPPAAADLIAVLSALPNPTETTRQDYVALNLAVQGCIRGLEALDRCDTATVDEIRDAAAGWSARWESDRASSYEDERARWESDWSQRDNDISGWRQVLDLAEQLGVPVAGHRLAAVAAEFGAAVEPEPTPVPATPAPADPGDPAWESKLTLSKGVPVPNLANLMFALRRAPQWVGVFRLDTFGTRIIITRQPPWSGAWTGPRELGDADFALIAEWFQNQAIAVSVDTCKQAVRPIAREAEFSPLRDYLESLTWDGVSRADTWLIDHLGAADTAINRAFGARFLIGAVARGLQPGCQVDTMLVIEGPQGLRKSSALRALAGDAWFTDHIPDLAHKDAAMQLQGVWIVEHAEMATLDRADAARAKEFITRRVDRFRPPYGGLVANFPRQCVFTATVNPGGSGYLRDETGARRFWPVACGATWQEGRKVDIAALAAVRDQLWAEAVALFRAGESWWLDTHELEMQQVKIADARYDADAWTDEIAKAVDGKPFVRMPDVLAAMGIQVRDQTHTNPPKE